MRILIVEDESAIADVERAYLERDGYSVDIAPDGLKALEMFDKEEYDLLLLDIMLPGLSGSDVCTTIRRKSDIPIIMVTAKSGEEDVISGLDAGADDYIIKPFSQRVMMARVRANLRKSDNQENTGQIIAVGDALSIDVKSFTVKKYGDIVPMTRNEFLILSKMAERADKTWSRDELITYALGDEYDGFERSIDSYIKNIRKKLADPEHENGFIKTVHGFGYRVSEHDR